MNEVAAGPVAQSVERWTPYGGNIRPGSKVRGSRPCLSSILVGMVAVGGRP